MANARAYLYQLCYSIMIDSFDEFGELIIGQDLYESTPMLITVKASGFRNHCASMGIDKIRCTRVRAFSWINPLCSYVGPTDDWSSCEANKVRR